MLGSSPIAGAPTGSAGTTSAPAAPVGSGAIPHYAGATIMRFSLTRWTTTLGPDRLQQTLDFP